MDQRDLVTGRWRRVNNEELRHGYFSVPCGTYGTEKRYEACPESKDTKVLNMYNIFNLEKGTVNEFPVHDFIFQHRRRHCPNIF